MFDYHITNRQDYFQPNADYSEEEFNSDAFRLYEKLGMKVQFYRMEQPLDPSSKYKNWNNRVYGGEIHSKELHI